jgi:hypothetical protein
MNGQGLKTTNNEMKKVQKEPFLISCCFRFRIYKKCDTINEFPLNRIRVLTRTLSTIANSVSRLKFFCFDLFQTKNSKDSNLKCAIRTTKFNCQIASGMK